MKQSSLGLGTSTKRTRRREFLDEMDRWCRGPDLGRRSRRSCPKANAAVRRSRWSPAAHPLHAAVVHVERPGHGRGAARHAPCSATSPAWAAGMTGCPTRAPSCDSAMCWRSTSWPSESWQPSICPAGCQGLMLRSGTVVDATLISAPSSTRTPAVNEDRRCTKARRASSGSSA